MKVDPQCLLSVFKQRLVTLVMTDNLIRSRELTDPCNEVDVLQIHHAVNVDKTYTQFVEYPTNISSSDVNVSYGRGNEMASIRLLLSPPHRSCARFVLLFISNDTANYLLTRGANQFNTAVCDAIEYVQRRPLHTHIPSPRFSPSHRSPSPPPLTPTARIRTPTRSLSPDRARRRSRSPSANRRRSRSKSPKRRSNSRSRSPSPNQREEGESSDTDSSSSSSSDDDDDNEPTPLLLPPPLHQQIKYVKCTKNTSIVLDSNTTIVITFEVQDSDSDDDDDDSLVLSPISERGSVARLSPASPFQLI